jgi:predicted transcriptional regulator
LDDNNELIALTADIVASFVGNNKVGVNEIGDLVASVHAALSQTANPVAAEAPEPEPAVSVRSSVKHDYIVCLEDGKKLKMLKRYLRTNYDMTPDEYRTKWKLPRDYPMVAPAYAEKRRGLAVAIGLGRKVASVAEGAAESVTEAVTPTKRGRPAKAKVEAPKAVAKPAAKPRGIKAAKDAAAKHLGGATGVDG